jgi:hypothetical protein
MTNDGDPTAVYGESDSEDSWRRAAMADGRIAALEFGLGVRARSLGELYERVLRVERERATLEHELVAVRRELERALGELKHELARKQDAERELKAIEDTKMFRWLRPLRDAYGHLRGLDGGSSAR